ncbi:hypothetical protein ABIA31_001101 [Catenulispora sp. MAP5-51]|uniref:DinB family protein n=1 Tax=Catenulispora sp. MAP5-51 TaxID=3156298 RepID=UPI0035121869
MTAETAKDLVHRRLKGAREALVWKLDGLSEYDVRRPMTATGTNLLGLVKHLALWESRYFGEVFGRPFPEPLPRWQDSDGSEMWAARDETRAEIVGRYRRVCAHADATISELPADAPGHVPWWTPPETELFAIVVHLLDDTARHAGHADIMREQIDGRTGYAAAYEEPVGVAAREALHARIEAAAKAAPEF